MNAYERIDDYELLSGVALTEAQENNVAANIRAALDEFRPLRLNTRKTRTLFNKKYHLWPVQTDQGRIVPAEPVPRPNSVDLNSLIFLYALYTVVKEDPSYALLHNFIAAEILSRNVNLRWEVKICDESHVDFYVEFDMADIKQVSQQTEDTADRLQYLESKLEALSKYDFSTFGNKVKVKLYSSTESQLQALIQEAKAAHEAATVAVLNQDGVADASVSEDDGMQDEEVSIPDWSDASDLFYNPNILGLAHFHDLDFEMYANYASSDEDNQEFFKIWLWYTFTNCYYYDPKTRYIVTEHSRIWTACSTIRKLFDDYVTRLENSSKEWTFLSKAERLTCWIRVTLDHIEEAFNRYEYIDTSKYVPKGVAPQIVDTQFLRNGLVSYVFGALINHRKLIHGVVPDRFDSVVFYNFWPQTYEADFNTYYGEVGLPADIRAKVYRKANREYFKEQMKAKGEELVGGFGMNPETYSYLSDITKEEISKSLQDMFYNYMVRIGSHIPDEDERASAGLNWIIETMHVLKLQLTDQVGRARMKTSMSPESRDVFEYFYLDCCLCVLNKMLVDFIEDNSELHDEMYAPDYAFDDSGVGECEWEMYDGNEYELTEDGDIVPISDMPEQEPNEEPKEELDEEEEAVNDVSKTKEQIPATHLHFGSRGTEKKRPFIVDYLHRHVGYKCGVAELLYIVALYEKEYILLPTPKEMMVEFPIYTKPSTVSSQIGQGGRLFNKRSASKIRAIEHIMDEFEAELKTYLLKKNNEKP